jgi:hypothetical protein
MTRPIPQCEFAFHDKRLAASDAKGNVSMVLFDTAGMPSNLLVADIDFRASKVVGKVRSLSLERPKTRDQ